MKKAIIFALLVLLALPLVFSACNSDRITASLGEQFTLPAGKNAVFSGQQLNIKFVEVTGDSRCPTGVECIQAGDAKCLMLISYLDSQSSLTFTQLGGNDTNIIDFNIYKITFKLEPYPEYGKEIAPEDYRLIMTVTK